MSTTLNDRLSEAFIQAFDEKYDDLIDRKLSHLSEQLETMGLLTEPVQNALLVRQNFSLYTPNDKYLKMLNDLETAPAAVTADDEKLIGIWKQLFDIDFAPFVLVYRDKDIRSAEEFFHHITDLAE